MRELYIKRKTFPYFADVLNYSRYDGEGIDYTAEVKGGSVRLTFKKDLSKKFLRIRHEKAKNLMENSNMGGQKDLA